MTPPRFILFIRTPFFEKKVEAYYLFQAYDIVKAYEHMGYDLSFYITTNRPITDRFIKAVEYAGREYKRLAKEYYA